MNVLKEISHCCPIQRMMECPREGYKIDRFFYFLKNFVSVLDGNYNKRDANDFERDFALLSLSEKNKMHEREKDIKQWIIFFKKNLYPDQIKIIISRMLIS